jgi:hypothetical protein
MKEAAQKFMNKHSLKECFECNGKIFKHKSNAEICKKNSGKEITEHTINAGVKAKANKTEEETK